MKNSVILEVTNDEFEFPLKIYETTKELAAELGIKPKSAQFRLIRPPKNKKIKYVRVWLNRDYEEEKYEHK